MFGALTRLFRKVEEHETSYTPDYEALQDAPGWPIFEYGSLKQDLPQHSGILGKFMSPAYTIERLTLWARNAGEASDAVAVRFKTDNQPPTIKSKVMGEVYNVPTMSIPFLDKFRTNGVHFQRKKVKLILPTQDEIVAFMYLGNKDIFSPWLTWDLDFYKGRKGSAFSLVEPQRDKKQWLNWFSNFTTDDFKEGRTKCFLGLYPNGLQQEHHGTASTVSKLPIV